MEGSGSRLSSEPLDSPRFVFVEFKIKTLIYVKYMHAYALRNMSILKLPGILTT